MADYGLKLVNASGFVQIDSTYKNLALRETGTVVSGGAAVGSTGWYAATLTTSAGTSPVIAFRCSSPCFIRYSAASGGTRTYYFMCYGSGVSVQYWIFDDPAGITGSGTYGLVVNNASGAKVFDSRMKYMRVIDTLSGTSSYATGDPLVNGFSRSYAGTPAVVQGQLYSQIINQAVGTAPVFTISSIWLAAAATTSGNTVTWKTENPNTVQSQTSVVPQSQQHANYDYLVLDVSNF